MNSSLLPHSARSPAAGPEATGSHAPRAVTELPDDVLDCIFMRLELGQMKPVRRVCRTFAQAAERHPALVALAEALQVPATFSAVTRHAAKNSTTQTQREVWRKHLDRDGHQFDIPNPPSLRHAARSFAQIQAAVANAVRAAEKADIESCARALALSLRLSEKNDYPTAMINLHGIQALAAAQLIKQRLERHGPEGLVSMREHTVLYALLQRTRRHGTEAFEDGAEQRRGAAAGLAALWARTLRAEMSRARGIDNLRAAMATNAHLEAAQAAGISPAQEGVAARAELDALGYFSNAYPPAQGLTGFEPFLLFDLTAVHGLR